MDTHAQAESGRSTLGPGVLGMILGALLYLAVWQIGVAQLSRTPIGDFIYNYYFLALIGGELHVPAQIAGLEGFYTEDGRAFLYHGIGPTITRAIAYPFVDVTQVDLRHFTIWLFATLGAAGFYLVALSVLAPYWPDDSRSTKEFHRFLWVAVWILGPGLMLASNGSFFHEPIAMAFGMLGLGLLCLWRFFESGFQSWRWILLAALFAGMAVHARPHVAVGLYAACVAACGFSFWRYRVSALLPIAGTMVVLLLFGLLYLQLNALRFGSVSEISGSVDSTGAQYGFFYWGYEPLNSERRLASLEHGSFNIRRLLPNFLFYGIAYNDPESWNWFARLTEQVGPIRIEFPNIGYLYLWTPWCILAVMAIVWRKGPTPFLLLALLATIPIAMVMSSYITITMRYRLELWSVFFVPALYALAYLLQHSASEGRRASNVRAVVTVSLMVGAMISIATAYSYMDYMNWPWGKIMTSYQDCAALVQNHPLLGADNVDRICVLKDL